MNGKRASFSGCPFFEVCFLPYLAPVKRLRKQFLVMLA